MQPYQRTQASREKRSGLLGIGVSVVFHGLLVVFLFTNGLTYLDPPPPETSFVIDFTEEDLNEEKPAETTIGRQPQAEEIDTEREVQLVQKSESPYVAETPNLTPATKPDPVGDVEVPAPEYKEEPKLDPRASFPGMQKKDTTATTPHSAKDASEGFKAGQSDGNTEKGRTEGSANAHVQGRSVKGSLPKPVYSAQEEGTVVVQVKVDQYGDVKEAIAGAEGTTVTDKNLWVAARNAAMKAHFNISADAPVLQTGTITYKFKLQ